MASVPVIAPVPKKQSDSMPDYITYFTRLSTANGWDDAKQAKIFPSLLEVGSKALDGMSEATLASFASMKKALIGENEPYRESNFAMLWNISRRNNETLMSFKDRIAGLVERVYPKFAGANKQNLIRDIFVHALPDNYKRFILSANSSKTEEALNSALLFESMMPKYNNNSPNMKNVGQPHPSKYYKSDRRDNDDRTHVNSASAPKQLNYKCHYCNEVGHFARDCIEKKKDQERNKD